jgi:hypothetical protein
MDTAQQMLELIKNMTYDEYRLAIKTFQGTAVSEGNLREAPLAEALQNSKKFKVIGTQYPVSLQGIARKNHMVDILLESSDTIIAVNVKSNGKPHTLSDHSLVADYTAYIEGLQRMYPEKTVVYALARNSDVKHGLIPELQSLGICEMSWTELFKYTETEDGSQKLENAIKELALNKLQDNAQRHFGK